ncbi:hypothetical protein ACFVHW_35685, partial [Streptomyces sp. NPDC127110]
MRTAARWLRAALPLLCAAALLTPAAPAEAAQRPRAALAFPVNEPFDSSANLGTTSGNASYPAGGGWLRLTSASGNQAGTWKMRDTFSTTLGIVAEFRYATYGGTAFEGKRGDGLSFYLTDGSAADGTGPSGGSLGYACAGAASRCLTSGVPGAYLGIGIDEFGNFSSNSVGNGGPGAQANKIVVRGGGSGTTGYRYATAADGPGSTVETGGRDKERRVRIALLPSGGKLLLSVWSDSGPGTALTQLITDYDVTTIANQPALPATLKVGFSAGTGGATNIHEIDDLAINVPADLKVVKSTDRSTGAAGDPGSDTVSVANRQAHDVSGAARSGTPPP